MKKLVLLLCMSLAGFIAFSQEDNSTSNLTTRKSNQQQKKEQKKAEEEAKAQLVERMVNNQQFCLEINFMSDQSRAFSQSAGLVEVSSELNYLAIDSSKITMQMTPNTYLTTNWGIGNQPVRGTYLHYKISKSKKSNKGYFVSFRTDPQFGSHDVYITISPNGNTDLRIINNRGEELNFRGVLTPLDQSRINAIFL
jgi:hypothetical protein